MKLATIFLTGMLLWIPENGPGKVVPIEKLTSSTTRTSAFIDLQNLVGEQKHELISTHRKIHHSAKK